MKSRCSNAHHYLSSSLSNRISCLCNVQNEFCVSKIAHAAFSISTTSSGDVEQICECYKSPLNLTRRCISLSEIAKVFTDMGANGVDSCNATWNNDSKNNSTFSSSSSSSSIQSPINSGIRETRIGSALPIHTNQTQDHFSERYLYEHRKTSNTNNASKFEERNSNSVCNNKNNNNSNNYSNKFSKFMSQSQYKGNATSQSSCKSNVPSIIQAEFNVQFATLLTSLHEEQLCSMLQRSRREFNYGNMILGLLEVYRRVRLQLCVTRTCMESMRSRQRTWINTNEWNNTSSCATNIVQTENSANKETKGYEAKLLEEKQPELIEFRELTRPQQRNWNTLSFIYTPSSNDAEEYYYHHKNDNDFCKSMSNNDNNNHSILERRDTLRYITTDRMLATLLSILTKIHLSEIDHDVSVWLASDEYMKLTHAAHNEWLPHELQISLEHNSFSHALSTVVERWLVSRVSDWDVHECIFFLHLLSQQNAVYHEALLATLADTIMLHSSEINDYNEFSALFDVMVRAQLELNNVAHLYEWEGAAQHSMLNSKLQQKQLQYVNQEQKNGSENQTPVKNKRKKRNVVEQSQSSFQKNDKEEVRGVKETESNDVDDGDEEEEEEEEESRLRRAITEKTLHHPIYNELFYNTIVEQMTRCLIHDELNKQSHQSSTTHSTYNEIESYFVTSNNNGSSHEESYSISSSKMQLNVNNSQKASLLPLMHEKVAPTLHFAQLPPISFLFLTRALAKLAFFHGSVCSALLPHFRSYLRLHPAHFKTVVELLGRRENTSVDASVFVILMHNIMTLLRRRGQTYAREMHMRANLEQEMACINNYNNSNNSINEGKNNTIITGRSDVGDNCNNRTFSDDNHEQNTTDSEDGELEELEEEYSNSDDSTKSRSCEHEQQKGVSVKQINKLMVQPQHFMLSFIPLNGLIKFVEALRHQYSLVMSNPITTKVQQLSSSSSSSLSTCYPQRSPPEKSTITKTAVTNEMKELFLLLLTDVHRGTRSIDTLTSELTTLSLEKLLELLFEFSFTLESDRDASTPTAATAMNPENHVKIELHPLLVELIYCWTRQVSTCVKRSRSDASYLLFHSMCYSVTWQRRNKTLLSYCLHYHLLMETNNPGRYTIPDEVLECAPRVQGAIVNAKIELKRHVLQNAKKTIDSKYHDMRRRKMIINDDINIHTSALFARFSAAMEFACGNRK